MKNLVFYVVSFFVRFIEVKNSITVMNKRIPKGRCGIAGVVKPIIIDINEVAKRILSDSFGLNNATKVLKRHNIGHKLRRYLTNKFKMLFIGIIKGIGLLIIKTLDRR